MESKRPAWVAVVTVLWVSFLFAGIATMLFFATFDPELISYSATFPLELDRMSGYSYGFFLFWILLVCYGAALAWLLRIPTKKNN